MALSKHSFIQEKTERNLHQLRQRLYSSESLGPYSPVTFLGAGFSIWMCTDVDVPYGWRSTWKELIPCVGENLPVGYGSKLIELSKSKSFKGQLEAVFGFAESKYGADYTHALSVSFWIEPIECARILGLIKSRNPIRWRQACDLFFRSRGVVTTNYDPIAWEIAKDCQSHLGDSPWRLIICDANQGVDHQAYEQLVSSNQSFKPLIMLHGGLHDPQTTDWPQVHADAQERVSKLVLSDRTYAQAYFYGEPCDNQICRAEFIRSLFNSTPLLFAGFSLSDTLINLCMNQARLHSHKIAQNHYAILHGETTRIGNTPVLSGIPPPDSVGEMYEDVYKIAAIFLDGRFESSKGLSIAKALDDLFSDLEFKIDETAIQAQAENQKILLRRLLGKTRNPILEMGEAKQDGTI